MTFKNAVASAQVNSSSVQLTPGNYMIQNVATGQYLTFKRFAGVTSAAYVNSCLLPESAAASVAVTFEANGAKFAGGGKCGAAQWNSDIGSYVIALVSYACESSAAAGGEWVKFIWFLLPQAKGSSISKDPASTRSLPEEAFDVETLEERGTMNGPYFIITADHLIDQITAALTGANISTYGGYLSTAITIWDLTDPFQLWTLTAA